MTPDPDANGPIRKRGIYLLPNLFTTGSLFAGFYSIISGMNQDFTSASIAIFIALIFDGLDGRVARLINAQSAFGAQYDSLADMLSFGVAPALLAYNWNSLYLDPIGWSKLAWLSAFIFSACVALRLARFNVQLESPSNSKKGKRYFYGVPCPAAAVLVASLIWVCNIHGYQGLSFSIALVIIMLLASYLMVSNIYFRSFKDIDLKKNIRFTYLVVIVFILAGIVLRPAEALCIIFALFLLSGPVGSLVLILRKKKHAQ
jgi:CDP-diacylglycerol--serine O-phosphatidyltransferase